MGDQPSRARVSVAVIGVGPNWEQHYRDAVLALSSRICVRAVCDPVHMRAAACADELRARAFSCPWLLAQRNDLHAWLILDPGWFGTYPAELAVQHCRPALLASSFSAGFHEMAGLFRRSLERGESLMPEFSQRFVPATTRLRELVATKLGPVRQIKIEVRRPAEGLHSAIESLQESQAELIGLMDWCNCLVGRPIKTVMSHWTASSSQLQLEFGWKESAPGRLSPKATIVAEKSSDFESATYVVDCERGTATITGSERIVWQTESDQADESLHNERSPYEILLDQFCRRALGGLVPAPTAADALRALTAFGGALESAEHDRPVALDT